MVDPLSTTTTRSGRWEPSRIDDRQRNAVSGRSRVITTAMTFMRHRCAVVANTRQRLRSSGLLVGRNERTEQRSNLRMQGIQVRDDVRRSPESPWHSRERDCGYILVSRILESKGDTKHV